MKTTDEAVKELFAKVQEKKLAIEKAEKPCWNTSCMFGFSASSAHDRVDIRTVTDQRKLIEMMAFLIERKRNIEDAAQQLGVELSTEFTWLGFTIDEWKTDFVTRVNQLSIQEKRKSLADLEARLNAIISPELRAQMELEAIQKMLE